MDPQKPGMDPQKPGMDPQKPGIDPQKPGMNPVLIVSGTVPSTTFPSLI